MYQGGSNLDFISATRRFSLRVDGDFLPIEEIASAPSTSGGYVSVVFKPTSAQVDRLLLAREVGFAFHPPNPAIFYGFTIQVTDPKDKYTEFLRYCVQNSPKPSAAY